MESKADIVRFSFGVVFALISIFLFLAIVSNVFTGSRDQAGVESGQLTQAANYAGTFGAYVSYYLMHNLFGLFSVLIPVFGTTLAIKLFVDDPKAIRLWKVFIHLTIIMVVGSVDLAFVQEAFLPEAMVQMLPFDLGGLHGKLVLEFMTHYVGLVSSGIVLALLTVSYVGYWFLQVLITLFAAISTFFGWIFASTRTDDDEEESEEEDGKEPIFQQVLKSHLEAINETNQLLDKEKVDQAVRMLTEARQIMFFGVGDSKTAAIEANNKFLHVTPKVMCAGDTHLQAMAASMMTEEDLLFVVSYSGSTKDTVEVAQIAKEAGAKVISITRFLKSPLTEFSDCVLICGSKEGPLEGGSMGAKLSQLHIIDILYQCYFKANGKKARENRQKTANAVVNKLY